MFFLTYCDYMNKIVFFYNKNIVYINTNLFRKSAVKFYYNAHNFIESTTYILFKVPL